MEFKELMDFIDLEDKRLIKYLPKLSDNEEILARMVKIGEEFGELCDEVLAFIGSQRKEKMNNYDNDNLAKEFADVIITTLLLSKTMKIDIKKALVEKIEKINMRYQK